MSATGPRLCSRVLACAAVLAVLALAGAAPAAADDRARMAAAVHQAVADVRAQYRIPGVVVLVVRGGTVELAEEQGLSRSTPLAIGSTSKQFTGLIVQQLIAAGRLSLGDTIGSLLDYAAGSPLAGVTVAQLLGHRSGLAERAGAEWDLWPQATTIQDEARRLVALPRTHAPGTTFEYANANYTLLGAIVESVTGSSYPDALTRFVTDPLGLDATTGDPQRARAAGAVEGHYPWLRSLVTPLPQPQWPMAVPSAFVTSTGDDLARVLLAQLGTPGRVAPAVLEASRTPLGREDEWREYASGWERRAFWELTDGNAGWQDPALPPLWEHSGSTLRTFSYLGFAPARDLGIVILGDTSFGIDQDAQFFVVDRIIHAVVGTQPVPAQTDPLIAAAPVILVALPLIQGAAVAWLAVALRRPRRSRAARWLPVALGVIATLTTAAFAFLVVPGRINGHVFTSWLLTGSPDLALSLWLALVLGAVTLGLLAVPAMRSIRRATR